MSKPHKWAKEIYNTKQTSFYISHKCFNEYKDLLKRCNIIWVC